MGDQVTALSWGPHTAGDPHAAAPAPEAAPLLPYGSQCDDCLHPWWAHLAQHENAATARVPHCIGEACRCLRRQAGGVRRA